MPRRNPPRDREWLVKIGMNEGEIKIWYGLADLAGKMLKLKKFHPMENHEIAHDIHKLQNRLLARPYLRATRRSGG